MKLAVGKNLSFTIEKKSNDTICKMIDTVMRNASSIASCVFTVHKKKVYFIAVAQGVSAYHILGKSSKEGTVVVAGDILKDALKNKKQDMEVTTDKDKFSLKSGRFNMQLNTNPVTPFIQVEVENFFKEFKSGDKLSDKATQNFKQAMRYTSIDNVFGTETAMLTYIVLEHGKLEVVSYDEFHVAKYSIKVKDKTQLSLGMPQDLFRAAAGFIEAEEVAISLNKSSVAFRGANFGLRIPSASFDKNNLAMYMSLQDSSTVVGKFDVTSDMVSTLRSMLAIHSKKENSPIEFVLSKAKNTVAMNFKTDRGSSSDKFKVKGKFKKDYKINFSPLSLLDSIRLLPTASEMYILQTTTQPNAIAFVGKDEKAEISICVGLTQ